MTGYNDSITPRSFITALFAGAIAALTLTAVAGPARADDGDKPAADVWQVVGDQRLAQPAMNGQYVCYHLGRTGRYVYNLAKRQQKVRMDHYRTVPYDLNDDYVFAPDGREQVGWVCHLESGKVQRRRIRRFDSVRQVALGEGWFVAVANVYDRDRDRTEARVQAYHLNGRQRTRPLSTDLGKRRIDAAGRVAVWMDHRIDAPGIYIYRWADRDARRLIEADNASDPQTDGEHVVWVEDGRVKVHRLEDGQTFEPLLGMDHSKAVDARIAGPWLVWADPERRVFAMHRPTETVMELTRPGEHRGMNVLIDASEQFAVWQNGSELWAAAFPEIQP